MGDEQDGLGFARGVGGAGDDGRGVLGAGVELGEEVTEGGLDLGAGNGVQGAEGFVEEEDGGVRCEGAGEADALTLAPGELPGEAGGQGWVQAGKGQDLCRAGCGVFVAHQLKREGDVALDGHVGKETGLLDAVADGAAKIDGVAKGVGDTLDADLAGGGLDERVDGSEEGGLAGAGAAEESGGGSLLELEGDVFQDGAGLGFVGDGGELYGGGGHRSLSGGGFEVR